MTHFRDHRFARDFEQANKHLSAIRKAIKKRSGDRSGLDIAAGRDERSEDARTTTVGDEAPGQFDHSSPAHGAGAPGDD